MNQDPKDTMQFVPMPFIKKGELTDGQVKQMKRNMARMIAMINLILSLTFSRVLYSTVQTAMEQAGGLGSGIMFFLLIILIVPAYYVWKTYRIAKGEG